MRVIFICFIAAFFTIQATASATAKANSQAKAKEDNAPNEGSFAFGFSLGTNSSLSGKYWITSEAAVDLGVENTTSPWKVYYADFLWHFPKLFGSASKFARETTFYVGAGLGAGHWQREEECGRWKCSWSTTTSGSGTAVFARGILGCDSNTPPQLPRRIYFSWHEVARATAFISCRTHRQFYRDI